MRILIFLTLTTASLSISTLADARDVNMMRFNSAPVSTAGVFDASDIVLSRSAALGSNPFVDALSEEESLTDNMRRAFEESANPVPKVNPLDSIDLDNLPTSKVPLPAWMSTRHKA